MDAKKLQGKGKSGKADKALAQIQKLYGIESRLKGASVETRQAYAKPIKYTLGQWPKLIRYIDNIHLSIDNNCLWVGF